MSWLARTVLLSMIVAVASKSVGAEPPPFSVERPSFAIERIVAHQGFDGETCWVHARAGAIPPQQTGNPSDQPLMVMTMQKLLLTGSDVFFGLNETRSSDGGLSWTAPSPQNVFQRQTFQSPNSNNISGASVAVDMLQAGDVTTVCDFVQPGTRRVNGCLESVKRFGIETIAS